MLGELFLGSFGYLYYKSSSYFPEYHQQYITKLPDLFVALPGFVFLLFLIPLLHQLYKFLFQSTDIKEPYHGREFPKYFPKVEGYPKPYPNGWFKVCNSHELKAREIKYVETLGERLAVFRTQKGKVTIMNAYCPHLGANIGLHGKVVGDCIECPFHGWTFDENGKCVSVPYGNGKSIPSNAKTKVWTSLERNRFIYVWYHANDEEPHWEPSPIKQVENGSYSIHATAEHFIDVHIQDIAENGVDLAHFNRIHGVTKIFGVPLLHWSYEGRLEVGEGKQSHVCKYPLVSTLVLFGFKTFYSLNIDIHQDGPSSFFTTFWLPILGNFYVYHAPLPVKPMQQKMQTCVFGPWWVPKIIGKLILQEAGAQIDNERHIWAYKRFIKTPVLVNGDGQVGKFRKYFSQFYCEESKSFEDVINDTLEW